MNENERIALPIGIGVAFGASLGAVLFAFTQNPVWIGLGAGIGVALGAAVMVIQSSNDSEN